MWSYELSTANRKPPPKKIYYLPQRLYHLDKQFKEVDCHMQTTAMDHMTNMASLRNGKNVAVLIFKQVKRQNVVIFKPRYIFMSIAQKVRRRESNGIVAYHIHLFRTSAARMFGG